MQAEMENDVGVPLAHNIGVRLFEDYQDRTHYGDESHDEALHNSIEYVIRRTESSRVFYESDRANLYVRLEAKWKETPVGQLLDMVIKEVREWLST